MNKRMHRVLVADDHSVVRRGIVALLDQQEDIAVVGQAGDGEAAVKLAAELRPDVVILDVRMPGMGGVEACSRIREVSPESRVVFFTSFPDEEALVGAMLAGASGFILKNLPDDSLVKAIRAVARGESILDHPWGLRWHQACAGWRQERRQGARRARPGSPTWT
ncbi:MAG: response regulator transcription factor [Firmicutes bacterium]|nr:response regulator transcription factor [Bacillota bacterium]